MAAVLLLPLVMLGFAFGALVLLVSVQLAAAAASLHWQVSSRQRASLHLGGLAVWMLVVPVQLLVLSRSGRMLGPAELGLAVAWLLMPLIPARWWWSGQGQAR